MKGVIVVNQSCEFPCGYTISDNRIEDYLQKLLTPAAYVVWRQYLRFWGNGKNAAYPSLSYISDKTGLSEKTIRRANKELVEKGFLNYNRGFSGEPNRYYYVPIEKIMSRYYNHKSVLKREPKVNKFIEIFSEKYKEKFSTNYIVEKKDVNAITKNIKEVVDNFQMNIELLGVYFKSKNKFISNSDYSIYLFFVDSVRKSLINELQQTDRGRWIKQAESILSSLELSKIKTKEDLIKSLKLSGGSSIRDKFVLEYIYNKLDSIKR